MSSDAPIPIPVTVTQTTTLTPAPQARPDNWRTLYVVGGLHGALVCGLLFFSLGWKYGAAAFAFLLFEGWTLTNAYKEDTISEAFWIYSQRSVSVMLVCSTVFLTVGMGLWGDIATVMRGVMLGGLLGHFYFSRETREFVTSVSKLFEVKQ
jgi:hypothetical protein